MLKHILPLIPKHDLYTEAFVGGASVFFAKEPVQAEIINDLNGELINFYKVAQSNYTALKHRISLTLHSRDEHSHATHVLQYPLFFDEIERAWAVWALSKMSFASKLNGTFGYDFFGAMPKRLRNAKDSFTQEISQRLGNVTIESRDALHVIKTYDKPSAWHFIDPPYVGTNCGHYDGVFGQDDLGHLLELLTELKGKFMLTMFPNDLIAEYAKTHGWIIHRIERTISAARSKRRTQEEWIVCNYSIDED